MGDAAERANGGLRGHYTESISRAGLGCNSQVFDKTKVIILLFLI